LSQLLIIGAGGHGAVVAEAAAETGNWSEIAFLDDNLSGEILPGLTVEGTVADLVQKANKNAEVIVAVGENRKRIELLDTVSDFQCRIATVVHPASTVSPSATIGEGSVLFGNVVVNARATIGRGAILNTACTIDHDCLLEDGVHVSPGANLAGNVRVGRYAWIGIGSAVREGVTIGKGAIVGAGAAVVSDVPDGVTVGGVPARVLSEK
jgi:sugar O-acyltransferase (sialic acid O-acetyltransferase NeuD family)